MHRIHLGICTQLPVIRVHPYILKFKLFNNFVRRSRINIADRGKLGILCIYQIGYVFQLTNPSAPDHTTLYFFHENITFPLL